MTQNSGSIADRLDRLAEKGSTKWIEDGNYRQVNSAWLRKSALIALRILRVLRDKGISQKDFAALLGVTPQYVSKVLKGQENLSLETICRIEEKLGIAFIVVPELFSTQQISTSVSSENGNIYSYRAIKVVEEKLELEPCVFESNNDHHQYAA